MLPNETLGAIRERFERFSWETSGQSPLYERLSVVASRDQVAIEITAAADARQQRPNLLFAAVHDLLLAGREHRLARYYPSVGGTDDPDSGLDEAFLDFLRSARPQLEARVSTRATQTNEVGRAAALWPAVSWLGRRFAGPLALIELGSSAGLLLHLDRYGYRFADRTSGANSSPVLIEPHIIGAAPPNLDPPAIARRIGVDLNPLDPGDESDARWLIACVWPDQTGRIELLRAAVAVARQRERIEVVTGDITTHLPEVLAAVDDATLPVVFHSAALAYLGPDARAEAAASIAAAGSSRDLAWISLEGPFLEPFGTWHRAMPPTQGVVPFLLGLTVFVDGRREDELLARAHHHGQWLEWLAGT